MTNLKAGLVAALVLGAAVLPTAAMADGWRHHHHIVRVWHHHHRHWH